MLDKGSARPGGEWRPARAGDHGDDRLRALVSEMQGSLALVLREGPNLYQRARRTPAIGFPTSSEPSVLGVVGIGDRVGELAASRVDAERRHPFTEDPPCCEAPPDDRDIHGPPAPSADPVQRAWFVFWDEVNRARNALLRAERAVVETLRPEPKVIDPDLECCVSHLRIKMRVPAWKSGRCWWCSNQRRLLGTGEDVWVERVRAYEDRKAARAENRAP